MGIYAYLHAFYLLLFTGGSSQRGGSARRGVAKQPSSRRDRNRWDKMVELEDGTFTTRSNIAQQEKMAAREAAKEREQKVRKRKKPKNSTMYTIPISDYRDVRMKFVYNKAKTSRDCLLYTSPSPRDRG